MPTPGDPVRKLPPGQKIRTIPREVYNATIDAIDQAKNNAMPLRDGTPRERWEPSIVRVRNTTGSTVARHGVLEVEFGDAPIPGDVNSEQYKRFPIVNGITPTDDPDALVCITLEPILDGEFGKAVLSGLAVALVDVTDAAHTRCEPTTSTGYLTSSAYGPIRIVHLSDPISPGATQLAYVLLSGQRSSAALRMENHAESSTTTTWTVGDSAIYVGWANDTGIKIRKITGGGTPDHYAQIELVPANSTQWGAVTDDDQAWLGTKTIQGVITGSPQITDGRIYLEDATAARSADILCAVSYSIGVQDQIDFRIRQLDDLGAVINIPFWFTYDDVSEVMTCYMTAAYGTNSYALHVICEVGQPTILRIDGFDGVTDDVDGVGTFRGGLLVSAASGGSTAGPTASSWMGL